MKNIFKTAILLLFITQNAFGQFSISRISNQDNEPNYFKISAEIDSILSSLPVTDTSEGGETNKYARWKWFYSHRIGNQQEPAKNGYLSNYIEQIQQMTYTCNNPTNLQSVWEFIGPFEHNDQKIGRIDVVLQDPVNPEIVYAGAPSSGLWRTLNKSAAKPVWKNITDNILAPGVGVVDFKINPGNNNEAYLALGIKVWGNYSLGLYRTINLNSTQPNWVKMDIGTLPTNQFIRRIFFQNNIPYVLTKDRLYYTLNSGNTWSHYDFTNFLSQNSSLDFFDFRFDKFNSDIIFFTGRLTSGNAEYLKVYRYNVAINEFVDQTSLLSSPIYNKDHLLIDNGQNGTYILYSNAVLQSQKIIERTSNSGTSWSIHNVVSSNNIRLSSAPFLEVSDANDQIIYTEGGGSGEWNSVLSRNLIKSINGGSTFFQVGVYNDIYLNNTPNKIYTHSDVRGFHLVNGSSNGLSDEILLANDGGILYSKEAATNGSIQNVYWKNLNGYGLSITQLYGFDNSIYSEKNIVAGAQDNGFVSSIDYVWNISPENGDGYSASYERFSSGKVLGQINSTVLRESEDNGVTWTNASSQPEFFPSGFQNIPGYYVYMDQVLFSDNEGSIYTGFNSVAKFNKQTQTWEKKSFLYEDGIVPGCWLLQDIAVSNTDKNVMFAAFEQPTWDEDQDYYALDCNPKIPPKKNCVPNCPLKKKLFRTTNALSPSPSWTDITGTFDIVLGSSKVIRWHGITGLAVSPDNDNRVYVTFDQYSYQDGKDRVYISNNALANNPTWSDYSNNLPNVPVNCIVTLEGSNGGVFIGNDLGVYFTNNNIYPTQGWVCVSNGLPVTIVTELKVSYCSNKLRASTFGRGMWEMDITPFLQPNVSVLGIYTNTTYADVLDVNTDIVIAPDATLTITGELRMGKGRKIVVMQGAKLIVDGGTITNYCHLWEGIEVWGDKTKNQFGAGNQGIVELKNGATIENAMLGIRTWRTDANGNVLWNTTGGIVKAENSTFRNCKHGVSIYPYKNTLPNGNPANNLCRFTGCTFEITNTLNNPAQYPGQMITLYDVEGIPIRACTFENKVPQLFPYWGRGKGIISHDASYNVIPGCSSPVFPCPQPNVLPNTFKNLWKGIDVATIAGVAKVKIDKSQFINNILGIRLGGSGYAEITGNNFEIPLDLPGIQFGGITFGIYTDGSFGHLIENNTFTTFGPDLANYSNYAILSNNTMNNGADIYRNTFNNTAVGIIAQGNNSKLTIDCNTHQLGQNNIYDWAVASGDLADQGLCVGGLPAKNDFLKPCSDDQNIYHWSQWPPFPPIPAALVYAYKDQPQDEPECRTIPEVYAYSCLNSNPNVATNPCLPKISGPGAVALKPAVNALKLSAQGMQNLIDGGNTQSLLSIINSNTPPGQIKNALMTASPYLSDVVLLTMLQKNPSLPHGHIKEIILANSPLTSSVWQALSLINLPPGIKNEIQNAQTGISQRRLLEADIQVSEAEAQSMLNAIVRYYLDSTYIDSAVAYLAEQKNTDAICALVPICLQYTLDTLAVCTHLALLSNEADSLLQTTDSLRGRQLRSFCDIYTFLFRLKYSEEGYFGISQQDSTLLRNVALSQHPLSVQAKNLFYLVYGEDTLAYAEPLNTGINARKAAEEVALPQSTANALMKCYPNPFTGSTQIEIKLTEEESAVLQITDITGKILVEEKVSGSTIITLSEKMFAPGIYLCRLLQKGNILARDKLIKIK
jgi:hypothetical protein